MGIHTYSPEVKSKISQLCADCAFRLFTHYPNQSIQTIESFLRNVTTFLTDNFVHLGAKDYLITMNFSPGKIPLSVDGITEELISGNNVFNVDENLAMISIDQLPMINLISVSRYSLDNDCITILVHNGIDITVFAKNMPIEQRNLRFPSAQPVLNKRFNRPAIDYKVSLIEFYKEKIRTNLTKHWQDPSKRILKGGKTEEIFQLALVEWLNDNLTSVRISQKVKKINTDETDIEIIKHGGQSFLLELKWLGTNASNTKYGTNKIAESIDQIENYLEEDLELLEATLVVFDGRSLKEFTQLICIEEESENWKEIKECDSKKLSRRGTGYVFHLISETASKRKRA